jgi:hypothetical protein
MQAAADYVAEWSCFNLLNINTRKTKEMLLGLILRNPPPQVSIDDGVIERVTAFKLLGVTITNDLSWNEHVGTICAKAGRRLHLLTLLKLSSVPCGDMLQYYKSVIRPVIEYAAASLLLSDRAASHWSNEADLKTFSVGRCESFRAQLSMSCTAYFITLNLYL